MYVVSSAMEYERRSVLSQIPGSESVMFPVARVVPLGTLGGRRRSLRSAVISALIKVHSVDVR